MQNKRIASMPIDINRPQSALLRGVRITEFQGHIINPDPVVLQETDFLLDEFLSPTKLKALTGVNDLALVDNLEMIVDTSETSLGNFGIYLPLLKQLKLNGSHVPRIRDLGTSLVNLKVLWLSRSSLQDLDGIPTLTNLEEVYLAFNEISDLSPCSMLENLKCLDLEGNLIDDIKQIEFLNLCTNLTNLTLYGNPICAKPNVNAIENDETYSYRHEMIKLLPDLKILDDDLTLNTSIAPVLKNVNKSSPLDLKYQQNIVLNNSQHECPFDDDWQLINQFIEEGIGPSEDKLAISESLRPGTSSSRGSERLSTGVRPLSSMRPLSSYRIKTALNQRPTSRHTNSSNSNNSRLDTGNSIADVRNDSSDLTVGPALQGNPLKALLARKKPNDKRLMDQMSENTPTTKLKLQSALKQLEVGGKGDLKSSSDNNDRVENNELASEINAWKKDHAKKLEERKEYFEPQVLKIEDSEMDDLPELSDGEDQEEFLGRNQGSADVCEIKSLKLPRSKTAFKQNFDYEVNLENEVEVGEKLSRVLSSAGDGVDLKDRNRFLRSRVMERDDSDLSVRLATGDTGYESLSSASLASYTSVINSNNLTSDSPGPASMNDRTLSPSYNLKAVLPPTPTKPKIVTTTIASASPSAILEKGMVSKGGLKSLKSNLKPLPGIKAPKTT